MKLDSEAVVANRSCYVAEIIVGKVTRYNVAEADISLLSSPAPLHNFLLTYEGWNFNSGNYLFTTDTK